MVRRAGLLAVAAVVLAGVADAQYVRPARMDETGWLAMGAPAGATTGCVGVFLGSPLNLQCAPSSGIVYTVATKSLDVTDGRVQAGNLNAIPLPASGAVTVTPVLSKIGAITVVAGSALADGDALSVGDGVGVVPIEFDASPGDGTTGGAVPIVFDGTETATQIRDAVKAILDASGRDWTTSNQGADGIGLVRATPGATGGAITESVTDAGFSVTDWTDPTHATTYTYSLQACYADGTCNAAGPASSTAAGVATLSAANPNRLTWSGVPGSALYKIRRDVGGATQGVIWSGTALTVDDTGLAGDGSAKPTVDGTGVVTAGRMLAGDGSAGAPSVAFASYPSLGFHKLSLGLGLDVDGAIKIYFDAANKQIRNDALGVVGWTASNAGAALDTILTRAAAATLQLGAANSATPVAQRLKVQDATGTNTASAAQFYIDGPNGTGNAAVGALVLRSGAVQASGATAHVPTTRMSLKEGHINIPGLPTYANNAAALAGGLVAGDLYTITGSDPLALAVTY